MSRIRCESSGAERAVRGSAPLDLRDAKCGACNGSGATHRQSVRGCAFPGHGPAPVGVWEQAGHPFARSRFFASALLLSNKKRSHN